VSIEKGLGERNFSGAQTKRSLLGAAQQVALVCDSSKFGATSPVVIASLEVVNQVITDGGVPQEYLDFFASRQVPVEVV
jgi:DeoR/GlpR family transcriptional regulator of sugar metabolism